MHGTCKLARGSNYQRRECMNNAAILPCLYTHIFQLSAISFHQSRPILETFKQLLVAFKHLEIFNGSLHTLTHKRLLKTKHIYQNIWVIFSVNLLFSFVLACMTQEIHVPLSNFNNITHFQRGWILAVVPFLWVDICHQNVQVSIQ